MKRRFLLGAYVQLAMMLLVLSAARADLVISCAGCAPTVLGGTSIIERNSLTPPSLTVLRNPNSNSGLSELSGLTPFVLIPDNTPNGANLAMSELVHSGGNLVGSGNPVCDLPCSVPSYGLAAEWSSPGTSLADYLGDTVISGPSVPFDDLIAATQSLDPGAHGYFVYVPLIAVAVTFAPGDDPLVDLGGVPAFPAGTVITAMMTDFNGTDFLVQTNVEDSTGSANALILAGEVPEPSTIALLAFGIAGLFATTRRLAGIS